MSKKSKVLKYKVVNTNIDKKFIGKNLDLERVKSKGGPGDGGRKPPKSKAPAWFVEFRDEQREFNMWIEKQVSNLRNDVNTLKTNFNRVIKLNNLKH